MTREEWKERLPLIQAFVEGKTIQLFGGMGWVDSIEPGFEWAVKDYRIKPKPKLRPWKAEEVPVGAQIRYCTSRVGRQLILGTDEGTLKLHLGNNQPTDMSLKVALDCLEHSTDGGRTWHPCGILEEA